MSTVAPSRRVFRVASRATRWHQPTLSILQKRYITADEKPLPTKDKPGPGPNQDQAPSVSEEAAATCKITGEGGPEFEHGTPIQEVLKRDQESAKNAPEILKEQNKTQNSKPSGSRSFSTSTRNRAELIVPTSRELASTRTHKFDLPNLPLPPHSHMKSRSPEIVDRVARYLMVSGKLARAQRQVGEILNHLRTSRPPKINPARPLVPDAPPASQLPLNPVEYMTAAIDTIAPLVQIKSMKGMAGGGQTLPVPLPLSVWPRRRRAVQWIVEQTEKKKGHPGLWSTKFADELIAIVEGRSSLWEKRQQLHKLGTSARANVTRYTNVRR